MTLELPGTLAPTLQRLGRAWPVADEEVLRHIAEAFSRVQPGVMSAAANIEQALLHVEDTNDPRLTGSLNYFLSTRANLSSLKDFHEASVSISDSFHMLAGTVVALKAAIIGHLVLLATLRSAAGGHGAAGIAAFTAGLAKTRQLIDESVAAAIQMIQGDDDESEPQETARPEELERLAAWADDRQDAEDFATAVDIWRDLLSQLPEPAIDHPLAMWSHTSLGDALFNLRQFKEANAALGQALLAGGTAESFVWLRKGQSLVALGDDVAGVEALTSAYMLMGDEIFDDEDPQYRQLLAQHGVLDT